MIKIKKDKKRLGASDLCLIGAAEAMKYGSAKDAKTITLADYRAVRKARDLFEQFSDQEMAVALLICMVDLGRRIDNKSDS